MKLCMFSIFDSKAEAYIQPFFSPTVATAIRSFQTAVNDPTTQFAEHPGDYTLFELGHFNHETAEVYTHKAPVNHGLALTHQNPMQTSPPNVPLAEATQEVLGNLAQINRQEQS